VNGPERSANLTGVETYDTVKLGRLSTDIEAIVASLWAKKPNEPALHRDWLTSLDWHRINKLPVALEELPTAEAHTNQRHQAQQRLQAELKPSVHPDRLPRPPTGENRQSVDCIGFIARAQFRRFIESHIADWFRRSDGARRQRFTLVLVFDMCPRTNRPVSRNCLVTNQRRWRPMRSPATSCALSNLMDG
jgi:hypothetical protein